MKAIIPVAGAGTKLRPHTYTQPKALMHLAGKTILSVIIDGLIESGIKEFIFITGYLGEKIKNYILQHYPDLEATFVTQSNRLGTGHAIWLTKEAVNNDEILIVYGDTICDYNIKEVIASDVSQVGVRRVDDPRLFGVAEINDENTVMRLSEKPKIPKSNLALVGIYKIRETAMLFEALDTSLKDNAQQDGEYHLTTALQTIIENGVLLKSFKVMNWFDCGKKETLLETNATLLKKMNQPVAELNIKYPNAVIIPPVNIGKGCKIEHSIIGPDVSIGEHTVVTDSIIKNSIIGSFAELDEVVLKASIIGSDAYVHGLSQSLNIGDNTDIDLG